MVRTVMVALAASAAWSFALAQGAPCERNPSSPAWLPCGPDRVLTAEDLKQFVLKPDAVTRMQVKGGTSGRQFFANFHPDGKMEAGMSGGANIGRTWTFEGDKVCRNYSQVYRGPQCGTFELRDGTLFLVDADASRNPVTDMKFEPK